MKRRHLRLAGGILLALLTIMTACGPAPGGGNKVPALKVTPLSGQPASQVRLVGLKVDPKTTANYEVRFGGVPAAAAINADGSLVALVPLYMGSKGWPAPPSAPVTVEIYRNGKLAAKSPDKFQVLPLQHAPGTTQKITDDLGDIANSYDGVFKTFPAQDALGQAVRDGISSMLHHLISTGGNSLQGVIDGSAPMLNGAKVNLPLLDAVLASSGLLEAVEFQAASMQGFREPHPTSLWSWVCTPDSGPDFDLACQMEYRDWSAKRFARFERAKKAFAPIARIAGLVSIVLSATLGPEFIALNIPAAVLAVFDYVGKVSLGLLPSKFEKFDLTLGVPSIPLGGTAGADFEITATNDPVSVTVREIVDTALSIVDVVPGAEELDEVSKLRSTLTDVATWAMEWWAARLDAYNKANPGTFADPKILAVPQRVWNPVKVQPGSVRLLTLRQADNTVVKDLEGDPTDRLDWEGIAKGQSQVWGLPHKGSKYTILDTAALRGPTSYLPWVHTAPYEGGTFGADMSDSKKATAIVGAGEATFTVGSNSYSVIGPLSTATSGNGEGVYGTWQSILSLVMETADGTNLGIVCKEGFNGLNTPLIFDGSTCSALFKPPNSATAVGSGGATAGSITFDKCSVLVRRSGAPIQVGFHAKFSGTLAIFIDTKGHTKSVPFSGQVDAPFATDQASAQEIQAFDQDCPNVQP